ncbi:nucleosidase [Streptomyces sp. NPDC096310]|uniref:5'-methylthioadenosine/S-adenosylhomocysteine nucleosidase family protein n=1 Tax=Streptomyces sp. NPDC096310 TaxID=3366082 RepID=UPI00382D6215
MPVARPTVVVLTALPLEYEAVRAHLIGVEKLVHPTGTRAERGVLPGTGWQVALAEIGEGTHNAAALTERVLTWLRPSALLLVGVAGGLKDDIALGDVVVATKVYAYDGGKQSAEGFLARPEGWHVSHRLEQAARAALRWRPGVHFKPIAVANIVLADSGSGPANRLRTHYNDAVAVEMESSGVLHAAHLAGGQNALVIRGISDRLDDKRAADASGSQLRAAANASAAAVAVLHELELPPAGTAAEPAAPLGPQYGGDHIDFRGGTFHGTVIGKVVNGPGTTG